MKKTLLALIITAICFTSLFVGGQQEEAIVFEQEEISSPATGDFKPITITDSNGREVIFHEQVETIITLMPSTNEVLKILNCWDKVIGRGQWTTNIVFFPNLDKVPVISGGTNTALNYEKILELNPDLFLLSKNPGIDENAIVAKLSPYMNVMVVDLGDLAILNENVRTLGKILGREDEADGFMQFNDSILNLIKNRIKNIREEEKPKIFLKCEGYTADQLCTLTNSSSQAISQAVMTGGVNLAADLPGTWVSDVDQEWLMSQNPDVIIAPFWEGLVPGVWGFDVTSTAIASEAQEVIMAMNVFKNSNAVKNNRVYLYDSKVGMSPAAAIPMLYVSKWLHPELFVDIDPQEYHQEYLNNILGIDIDLSKNGTFFYPDFE